MESNNIISQLDLKNKEMLGLVTNRPSWEEFSMRLAQTAAIRSEDPYLKVGACVLRQDHSVAGLGYNGAPTGIELDWSDRDQRRIYIVHAEANALRYCKPGECSILACTLIPCPSCLTLIAGYRIPNVYYLEDKTSIDPSISFKVAKQLNINMQQLRV